MEAALKSLPADVRFPPLADLSTLPAAGVSFAPIADSEQPAQSGPFTYASSIAILKDPAVSDGRRTRKGGRRMNVREAAWEAVEADYKSRPDSARHCMLGDQLIVHPEGGQLQAPAFYILGFNGGETSENAAPKSDRPTKSARRWFDLCARAAKAVQAPAWGITERCHWGSPDIPTLIDRLGSRSELRRLLTLHAKANLAMFAETPPLVVWVTGLGYMAEAVEDHGLKPVGDAEPRTPPLKGILWREFLGAGGVPYLFSRHPTGARFATGEHDRLFQKLGELAEARRARLAQA